MLKNKSLLCISYSTCPTVYVKNTFQASLMEEYPQRDVIMSELGTCVLASNGNITNKIPLLDVYGDINLVVT